MIRGIRGAITVQNDTPEEIKNATVELITEIIAKNELNTDDFAYAELSITEDIKSATPAKFARTECGWHTVPMMCYREFEFEGGIKKCIRILIAVNTDKSQKEIKHIYLREAQRLRPDLKNS